MNIYLLSPDRLSGRNYITSDKVTFRPDIRQKLLFFFLKKKNQDIKSLRTLKISNLGKHMSINFH